MEILISRFSLEQAFNNSDPVLEGTTVQSIENVGFIKQPTGDEPGEVEVNAWVTVGGKPQFALIFVTVGRDGTLYADI
jgi:hypothetical protein